MAVVLVNYLQGMVSVRLSALFASVVSPQERKIFLFLGSRRCYD